MTSSSQSQNSQHGESSEESSTRRIVTTRRALPRQEKVFGSKREAESLPGLIEMPRKSYARFLGTDFTVPTPAPVTFAEDEVSGLQELLDEMNPIQDAGQRVKFFITDPFFDEPERTEEECRANDLTYQRRLGAKAVLEFADGGGAEQPVWLGFIPMMTPHGTFLINGAERVVISQLVRSPGVYFSSDDETSVEQPLAAAKVIPNRGAWLEFETSVRNGVGVKVDRKKRVPVTVLLRAIDSEELLPLSSEDKSRLKRFEDNFEKAKVRLEAAEARNKELAGMNNLEDASEQRADAQLELSDATHALEEAEQNFNNRLELTLGTNDRVHRLLGQLDSGSAVNYLDLTLSKDSSTDQYSGLVDFYKVMRPGDPPTVDTAKLQLEAMFFDRRGYDLGRVGRHKLNERLQIEEAGTHRELTRQDILKIIEQLWELNHGRGYIDDIDNLANRRVRPVGELVANQFRVGLRRMERVVRDRLMIADSEKLQEMSPVQFVNSRPVEAAMKEFFGGAQLSQFMDQVNPLSEIAHKRKLSALGPGGLSRDRAKFDVRDVHYSHYGRICPIETPEGPNIGLIGALAMYGEIDDFGFIQSPYYRVAREIPKSQNRMLTNRVLRSDVKNEAGKVIGKSGSIIDSDLAKTLSESAESRIPVNPFVTLEREIFTAEKERDKRIAEARTNIDEFGNIIDERVSVRYGGEHETVSPNDVDYIDVSAQQIVSIAAAMIPFLDHDLTHRALMGANMQRQAVPLIRPEAPLVGTGIERAAAADSAQVITAPEAGMVISATADFLEVKYDSGDNERFPLLKFVRSNQGTCINQRTRVLAGDRFAKGQALVDSSSTDDGKLALGQSVLVAIMPWDGYNYEDAVVLSESVVREDKFTSIHIEKHEVEARDTKIGPEEITGDIPNVSEIALSHLDERGVVRVGAEVREGDILVGKITPKGETELTPEEKLLRAIFGEKAREVRDTSLRVPHGEAGKVIDVRLVERPKDESKSSRRVARDESGFELPPEVNSSVRVWIAQKRHITAGDKMAGRHGNKGVVSKIVPTEDMPFLNDGRSVEVVLNPLGMPSRLNLGQVLETHLGWAASTLGFRAISPVFDGASHEEIEDMLARAYLALEAGAVETASASLGGDSEVGERVDIDRLEAYITEAGFDSGEVLRSESTRAASAAALTLWLEAFKNDSRITDINLSKIRSMSFDDLESLSTEVSERINVASPLWGKQTLFDGRTGERFDSPVTIGYMYMLKLIHLVDDKIHARSTGPYSLITQQPLGGKAQFGGQRFGEMEVWALEAYGAAHVLQEILTVKSDDTVGRVKTYEAIVKGDDSVEPGVPESFRVLMKELQALGIQVDILGDQSLEDMEPNEEAEEAVSRLGINLSRREIGA